MPNHMLGLLVSVMLAATPGQSAGENESNGKSFDKLVGGRPAKKAAIMKTEVAPKIKKFKESTGETVIEIEPNDQVHEGKDRFAVVRNNRIDEKYGVPDVFFFDKDGKAIKTMKLDTTHGKRTIHSASFSDLGCFVLNGSYKDNEIFENGIGSTFYDNTFQQKWTYAWEFRLYGDMAISPSGKYAMIDGGTEVTIIDTKNGKKLPTVFDGIKDAEIKMRFLTNENILIFSTSDFSSQPRDAKSVLEQVSTIYKYNIEKNTIIKEIKLITGLDTSLAFASLQQPISPDGSLFAAVLGTYIYDKNENGDNTQYKIKEGGSLFVFNKNLEEIERIYCDDRILSARIFDSGLILYKILLENSLKYSTITGSQITTPYANVLFDISSKSELMVSESCDDKFDEAFEENDQLYISENYSKYDKKAVETFNVKSKKHSQLLRDRKMLLKSNKLLLNNETAGE
jgi:hypothetical protein